MRPEFKYGLLTGAGVCLWIAAEYLLGFHTTHPRIGEYTGYFSTLIPLVFLYLLLRRKQSSAKDGRLTIRQGIASGVVASFLAALIVYGFMLAYNRWIDPDWIDNALLVKVAAMRAKGIGELQIRREITFYRNANSASGMIATTVLAMTVVGAFFSLLLTILLRFKKQRTAP